MVGEEDKTRLAGIATRRNYLRSASWTERSPTKPDRKPQPNRAARSCLPPLQPLSVARRNLDEWPLAGSDDLGVWPNPQTPGRPLDPGSNPPVREFQFKREKLAFFDKECSRIADYIYLGSDAVAKNREVLRENGITHVLNCVGFVCAEYFKNDLVYKTLWLQDTPEEDITSILYDVFDYFEDVREQGGRVLVHCFQGVSRSASLVIAYLMWREGQSFEDAFQYVKAARGVTNPNMGFACQLLQCQKRVHAVPASPNSVLRMYRMAPHSPYDPLHLVPKMLNKPGAGGLDSRGAFIVHVPSGIYVWTGRRCGCVMSGSAGAAASQVIRYERARGPVVSVREGEEPPEFWEALANDQVPVSGIGSPGERKVDEYDLDFEIFHKALAGGVVPPFSVSNTESETRLPARENGWGRLRRKFASGIMKGFLMSSKQSCSAPHPTDMIVEEEDDENHESRALSPSWSLASLCGAPDCEEDEDVPSPATCSLDSGFTGISPKFSSKSPTLSPSNSDYSSSFTFSPTFSPSSSNWSDLSCLSSQQPSPSSLEPTDLFAIRKSSLAETPSPLPSAAFFADPGLRVSNACPPKLLFPSIAERRGSNPPPRMYLSSSNEPTEAPKSLVRSWSFSIPDLDDEVMLDSPASHVVDGVEETTSPVLFECPAMVIVEMGQLRNLSSRSGYVLLAPDPSSGKGNSVTVYLWLGRDSSYARRQKKLLAGQGTCVDDHFHWQMVGRNLLAQMSIPWNAPIQVVKEGEEPEQFLKHLNHFLSQEG